MKLAAPKGVPLAKKLGVPEAKSVVARESKVREEFVQGFMGKNVADPIHCHVVFNNEKNPDEETADLIGTTLQTKKLI